MVLAIDITEMIMIHIEPIILEEVTITVKITPMEPLVLKTQVRAGILNLPLLRIK